MDTEIYELLFGSLMFGVPLAIAVRELIVLKREARNAAGRDTPPVPRASPPAGR